MNEDNSNLQPSLPEHGFDFGKTEEVQTPIESLGPDDTTKPADISPPDGSVAAWLVVLGAWCCSLSSPGWINSMYYLAYMLSLHSHHRFKFFHGDRPPLHPPPPGLVD